MKRILVIEDEKRIADILQKGLSEFGYDITICYDGEKGLDKLSSENFNLLITDIMLPQMSGFDVCKIARKQYLHLPIIMLTALGQTDDKLDGFEAGADDYMVKPFDIRELNARVSKLLNLYEIHENIELESISNEISYSDLTINLDTKTAHRGDIDIKLTPKEFNLLTYMLNNSERILSRTEIAKEVWDTHFDTGTNFIDVYINYLRKKIDRDFEKKLIHTRQGMGFILIEG